MTSIDTTLQHSADQQPSAAQWAQFERRHRRGRVHLVYLLRRAQAGNSLDLTKQALCKAAIATHGQVLWSGQVCAPLNPLPFPWHSAVVLRFPDASTCRHFVISDAHEDCIHHLAEVEVHTVHVRASTRYVIALMQWLMPWFAPAEVYSDRDMADESIGNIDADAMRLRELQADHSPQPVCILNFHRYRKHSLYSADEPECGETASGIRAYMRYGRSALRTVLGRGNRVLLLGHYGQCLIGKGGDSTAAMFDEVTLMQYHSRRELLASFSIKAMEGRLRHRRAGLEHAVMVIVEPDVATPARLPRTSAGENNEHG